MDFSTPWERKIRPSVTVWHHLAKPHGSSVSSILASRARDTWINPRLRQRNFQCPNTFPFVSFAGMTWKQCTIFWIRILNDGPLCRENHTLDRLKNRQPYDKSRWLLVGLHPSTRCIHCLCPFFHLHLNLQGGLTGLKI